MVGSGELSTLTNIVRVEQSSGIEVFNFTVEGNHNYFILAKEYDYGQTCVLVHNAQNYAPNIPGKPFYGKDAAKKSFDHLEKYHGVSPITASGHLHEIKKMNGFSPADNMVIGKSGDVFHPITGEWLGTLVPPKSVKIK